MNRGRRPFWFFLPKVGPNFGHNKAESTHQNGMASSDVGHAIRHGSNGACAKERKKKKKEVKMMSKSLYRRH